MGQLKADYRKINDTIEFIKKDPLLMEVFIWRKNNASLLVKCLVQNGRLLLIAITKRDTKQGRVVDLKYLAKLFGREWQEDQDGIGAYVGIFQYWGYWDQIAMYTAVEQLQERPGATVMVDVDGQEQSFPDWYEPFIAPITKQDPPDKDIISFNTPGYSYYQWMEQKLSVIEAYMPRILAVKSGEVEPIRCETCDHCRATKMLTGTSHYSKYDI